MLVVRKGNVMACDDCGAKKGHMGGCPKGPTKDKSQSSHPRNIKNPTDREKGMGYQIVTCITCRGSGKRGMRPCQLCGGRGRIRVNNK
jgi:DnaJ-class molecular chaperone